jgi:hypothetical protein
VGRCAGSQALWLSTGVAVGLPVDRSEAVRQRLQGVLDISLKNANRRLAGPSQQNVQKEGLFVDHRGSLRLACTARNSMRGLALMGGPVRRSSGWGGGPRRCRPPRPAENSRGPTLLEAQVGTAQCAYRTNAVLGCCQCCQNMGAVLLQTQHKTRRVPHVAAAGFPSEHDPERRPPGPPAR